MCALKRKFTETATEPISSAPQRINLSVRARTVGSNQLALPDNQGKKSWQESRSWPGGSFR